MAAKRKPGRPPGSLNKATVAKRAEAEAALVTMADVAESTESSMSDAPLCEPTAPKPQALRRGKSVSQPPNPESDVPDDEVPEALAPLTVTPVKVLGRRAPKTVAQHNVPEPVLGRRVADWPPKPQKRARVVVLDESSSSDEYTVVRRKKPRRAPPVPDEPEPEPLCALGDALSEYRQNLDNRKTTYAGFYNHLKR